MSATLPAPQIKQVKESRNVTVDVLYWTCSKCGRELGESSALTSFKLHSKVMCGSCSQKENPVYQEWVKEQGDAVCKC